MNFCKIEWKEPVTQRLDGSYVVTTSDLLPYHVPNEGEWKDMWAEVDTWAKDNPDSVIHEAAPTDEELLEEAKLNARSRIDAETSAAIIAGFDYEIDAGTGMLETLHFSYDSYDQQNFADTANMALLNLTMPSNLDGGTTIPTSVTWNAYRAYTPQTGGELVRLTFDATGFLALYTGGALAHKALQMEIGGQRKATVEAATTVEEVEAAMQSSFTPTESKQSSDSVLAMISPYLEK